MFRLGDLNYMGQGLPVNIPQAITWYERAAQAGNGEAMYNLGAIYQMGNEAVPKDAEKAVEWYTKAAESGVREAMYNLGVMYYTGTDIEKIFKKELTGWKRAPLLLTTGHYYF